MKLYKITECENNTNYGYLIDSYIEFSHDLLDKIYLSIIETCGYCSMSGYANEYIIDIEFNDEQYNIHYIGFLKELKSLLRRKKIKSILNHI